jgi:hypothetical protein
MFFYQFDLSLCPETEFQLRINPDSFRERITALTINKMSKQQEREIRSLQIADRMETRESFFY